MAAESGDSITEIDGSVLEGGGQILRIAVSLSALLRRPLKVIKIRAGRKKPGLSNQHMQGIELVKTLSHGKVEGCQLESQEVTYFPNKVIGGDYIGDSITAGSVSLLFQVALPCVLFADGPTVLRLRGGTNADFAPPIDYIQKVLLPILCRFGVHVELSVLRRGYFPKGGGEVTVKVNPIKHLSSAELTVRGDVTSVNIFSYVAGQLPAKICQECANHAEKLLNDAGCLAAGVKINKVAKKETEAAAVGSGSGLFIWAETDSGCLFAGSSNGAKKKSITETATEAVGMLVNAVKGGACTDEHLQDQLIIFMALAKGKSKVLSGPLTLHTKTAIFVCEKMLDVKFHITEIDGNWMIECDGIGFENVYLKP